MTEEQQYSPSQMKEFVAAIEAFKGETEYHHIRGSRNNCSCQQVLERVMWDRERYESAVPEDVRAQFPEVDRHFEGLKSALKQNRVAPLKGDFLY
ncbi:hypothetical protein HY450_00470 [Candidatus Pacearchaeota archaeon]|nr:hypothetical protein [Candidatus Pacearchaeota archaeon]